MIPHVFRLVQSSQSSGDGEDIRAGLGKKGARVQFVSQSTVLAVTSAGAQMQTMAMVLANQVEAQRASVRILLCDPAGTLAMKGTLFPVVQPEDHRTPKDLLQVLIDKRVRVDGGAIFLPNMSYESAGFLEGVGQVRSGPEAGDVLTPDIRYFKV